MDRISSTRLILLAGASALAMTLASAEAEAGVTYTGSVIFGALPLTGFYNITVFGAQGGYTTGNNEPGGLGAEAGGDIYLPAGTILGVLVGGEGGIGAGLEGMSNFAGGGGGGSFVFEGSKGGALLIAAGGGGGSYEYPGLPGLAGTSGGAGEFGSSGGSAGLGGTGATFGGGGGAGVFGGGSTGGPFYSGAGAPGVLSEGAFQVPGGFGGGGGGGDKAGGGGGGGFSGGGGGGDLGGSGGGGGSYLAAAFIDRALVSGVRTGNGYVTVSFVGPSVPESSTWAMMAAGFAGLSWAGLRRGRKGKSLPA
jgi:hypothetical protein